MQTCVIIAGGKSSRMQRDKTLLEFKGFPSLTHYQFQRLSKIFSQVFVSSKNQKFIPNLPLIEDKFEDFSPMGALYSILSNFTNDKIFIIPADIPFVSKECIEKLYKNSLGFDICVASDCNHTHNLCGFFSTDIVQIVKNLYDQGDHKISDLLKRCNYKTVFFENSEQFFNINYPQDYQKALNL